MARRSLLAVLALCLPFGVACRQDMHNQPKYLPLQPSGLFANGDSSRPLVEGTVARNSGKDADGQLVREVPVPVTAELVARGQQRYDIYCSPCHDRTGSGGGMIVLRGYKRPPSFHIDRLRDAADGYFFDVITNGFGVMPNYAQQIPIADRWAITTYVRALQLSQGATIADVPAAEQAKLNAEAH
jgi:mono/diheme cytochrome c family protein